MSYNSNLYGLIFSFNQFFSLPKILRCLVLPDSQKKMPDASFLHLPIHLVKSYDTI